MAKAGGGFHEGDGEEAGRNAVTVNCVSPATTLTDATRSGSRRRESRSCAYPLGRGLNRLGLPSDIANAVAFLASSRAEWITGQVLSVNGGYSMVD
jgi:NAD(P)-dependent dehydrogenase (short-subunit alcohol dehydrogenase family)